MEEKGKKSATFGHFVGYFDGKYVWIIGFKVPGNYSYQFWFDKISVLLCEGPKPSMSMISGFLNPWNPVFIDLNTLKIFRNIRKYGNMFENIICVHLRIVFWKFLKSHVPFCILDMSSTSLFYQICEDGDREMMKLGWIKSPKSWIWISYLSKKLKCKFANFSIFR